MITNLQGRLAADQEKLVALQNEIEVTNLELSSLQSSVSHSQDELRSKQEQVDALEQKLQEVYASTNQMQEENALVVNRVQQLEQSLSNTLHELNDSRQFAATTSSTLNQAQTDLQQSIDRISSLDIEIATVKSELHDAQKNHSHELSQLRSTIEEWETRFAAFTAELEATKSTHHAELQKSEASHQAELKQIQSAHETVLSQHRNETAKLKQELEQSMKQLQENQSQLVSSTVSSVSVSESTVHTPAASATSNAVPSPLSAMPAVVSSPALLDVELQCVEVVNARMEQGKVVDFVVQGELNLALANNAVASFEQDFVLFKFKLVGGSEFLLSNGMQLNPKCIMQPQPNHFVVKIPRGTSSLPLIRYKVDSTKVSGGKPPVLVMSQWQKNANNAKLVTKYKVNQRVLPVNTELSFLGGVDPENSVVSCLSSEPANAMKYNAQKQKFLFKVPVTAVDGQLSLALQTNVEVAPQPLNVSFSVENSSLAGLQFEMDEESSVARLHQVKHVLKSGQFLAL